MRKTIQLSLLISQSLFLLSLFFLYSLLSYLHPVVLVVVWFCLTSITTLMVFGWRKERLVISIFSFSLIFMLYNITLFVLLFFRPNNQSYGTWNLVPFSTIWMYLTESIAPLVAIYNLVANVCLFIPLGLYLMLLKEKKRFPRFQLIVIPLLLISLIEIIQCISHRGSLDIDDLILNFLGVLLGYGLYPYFTRVVFFK